MGDSILKSLNVLIDTLSIQPESGGVRIYMRELLRNIREKKAVDSVLICSKSNKDLFSDVCIKKVTIPWETTSRIVRVLTQQIVIPLISIKYKPDLLFSPVDVVPLLNPTPIVVCLHSSHINVESGYGSILQRIYLKIFTYASLLRAKRIIVISNYISSHTVRIFRIRESKLQVVYHGGGIMQSKKMPNWRPKRFEERLGGVLFVGTTHFHKRIDALLYAYALVKKRNRTRSLPPLSLVGSIIHGTLERIIEIVDAEGIRDCVYILGQVSDDDLFNLFNDSRLLVCPSEAEGFGLPIVEAMQSALPVVASNRGALPEIGSSAAIYADPDDISQLADAIEEALWNDSRREKMIQAGLVRGAEFDWGKTADKTIEVWKSVCKPEV